MTMVIDRVESPDYTSIYLTPVVSVTIALFGSHVVYRMNLDAAKGRQLGSYHLEATLGRAGMSEVWKAKHHMLPREAAIKLVPPKVLGTQDPKNAYTCSSDSSAKDSQWPPCTLNIKSNSTLRHPRSGDCLLYHGTTVRLFGMKAVSMSAMCSQETFDFQELKRRSIQARFDGEKITSDGGRLLLREVEKEDPTGESRVQERDRGKPSACKSTLNRLGLKGDRLGPRPSPDHGALHLPLPGQWISLRAHLRPSL